MMLTRTKRLAGAHRLVWLRWCLAVAMLLCQFLVARHAVGHELQPGFLDVNEVAQHDYRVLWKQPLGMGKPLPLTPAFPEKCQPQDEPTREVLAQYLVYRVLIRCENGLAGQWLEIEGLQAMTTDVLVRLQHLDGRIETHLLKPAAPGVRMNAESGGTWVSWATLGLEHIALGVDHLLFVLGLLLLVSSRMALVKTITSFTVAHSVTLAIATLTTVRVPAAALNALIALSIFFLAPEVVRRWRGQTSLTLRHPWVVAFLFGLLHGFGFASGLNSLGLPPSEVPVALLLFNLGVEAGQLGFVFLVFSICAAWRQMAIQWSPPMQRLPTYVLGTLGAYWTFQRVAILFGLSL